MELIKFIKAHDNWKELLTNAPYNIKITYDRDYVIFKYNQFTSDFNLNIVKECRGVILDSKDWTVAARGFDKFFNYGESYAATIDWSTAWVSEKVDGSILKFWYRDGYWHLSTNGTIDAVKATIDSPYVHNFQELFNRTFPIEFDLNQLDRNRTYIFEVVSPYHQIVIPYSREELFFLGSRDNATGKEYNMMDNPFILYIRHPKIYPLHSLKEILSAADALPWTEEGYVVCDANFNRIKIKSPAYVASHYLANNHVITNHRVIKIILEGESEEFLGYFPQYKTIFNFYQNKFEKLDQLIEKLNKEMFSNPIFLNSPREIVYKIISQEYPKYIVGYIMKNIDRQCSWDNYTKNWSYYKWEEFFQTF